MSPLRHLLLAAALAVACAAGAQPAAAPPLPLSELRPGMKGEVWTVFKGREPEPFAVQVTGIVQNALGPGKSLILCELTDPRVQSMGAVAGMSGSPLYIDGRLAGVLSYQIQRFETVRYAGFTPISDMLEVTTLPSTPNGFSPTPIPIRSGGSSRSDLDANPMSPVFTFGGLSPQVAELLQPQFQALGLNVLALGGNASGSAGTSTVSTPIDLKPGDVVAVALATGDISLAGTGTVSFVDGQRVLAFGHPMMSLGATELPMATAEVVTILPSQFNSVKITNAGRVIGTFSQDRLSGIYGEVGRQPHMVPVEVNFPGRANRKALHFDVVRHEQVLPVIAATGLAQAVIGSNEAGFAKGFKVTTTVEFPGVAPFSLSQIYPGAQGFQQGLGDFAGNLALWLFNPYERTFPDKISFSLEETPQIPLGSVEQLQVSRDSAAPGERVDINVGWRGFQQPVAGETFTLNVPPEWAGRNLEVILTTGPALDELTGHPRSVPAAQLRSFEDYVSALRTAREADGLYLVIVEKTRLFTDQRRATADLPGSLQRIAVGTDEARFQQRDAVTPLWEAHLLPGRLFNIMVRRPLQITD